MLLLFTLKYIYFTKITNKLNYISKNNVLDIVHSLHYSIRHNFGAMNTVRNFYYRFCCICVLFENRQFDSFRLYVFFAERSDGRFIQDEVSNKLYDGINPRWNQFEGNFPNIHKIYQFVRNIWSQNTFGTQITLIQTNFK